MEVQFFVLLESLFIASDPYGILGRATSAVAGSCVKGETAPAAEGIQGRSCPKPLLTGGAAAVPNEGGAGLPKDLGTVKDLRQSKCTCPYERPFNRKRVQISLPP